MNTQDYYSEPVDNDFKGGYQYGRRYTRGICSGLLCCVVIRMYVYTYVRTYIYVHVLLLHENTVVSRQTQHLMNKCVLIDF